MSRMTVTDVITRRMTHGDIATVNENGRIFVGFDSITAQVIGDRMVMELKGNGVTLASHEVTYYAGSLVQLSDLQGHIEVKVNV